jgi:iron-sulfur cluster repair protein YtfE (RIC family)
MNEFETGLRHRLRRALRQTAQQHQHLRTLHRRLDDAIGQGAVEAVRAAAERLHAALNAHFELEDSVIFPAVHGLEHGSAHDLNELAREHREYLRELERLRVELDAAGIAAFEDAYRAFRSAIGNHEQREESLLHGIEEVAAAPARRVESTHTEARRTR